MKALRRAGAADAAAIAGVEVRAWWHAYSPFLDQQRLSERTVEERTEHWREQLAQSAGETWVLEVDGRISGYVTVATRARDGDRPGSGRLLALYVDPPAQGAGAGTRLLEHAHRRLGELGFRTGILWTFEENGLARAFYERSGWLLEASDETDADCEAWGTAVRYSRELTTP